MTHDTPKQSPRLLTVDELAEYLAKSPQAIRQMIYRRQVPFVRVGSRSIRFRADEIEAWLSDNAVEAVG